ncbi:MAG TPA: M48 family metallopeptidase, partial [Bryobacteraceae bacterium]|nr:M48 family metallopeptidase [Bryobacteraceae bacterium]
RAGEPLKPGFNLFSKQQDIQLGQEAAAQVNREFQVVQNQWLQDYIDRVGRRLAASPSAAQSGFPFSFTLLNAKEVNAFALPGGPTFVFTGLIEATETEGELAGVLAHEIAHVVLRHGTNQVSKATLIQLPAEVAGVAVGQGTIGQIVQLGLGVGLNGLFLSYSREAENQADALGAHIMAEAGYNPIEMARFFEKLEARGGPGVPQFLSSHPSPGNRVKAVEAEIQTMPPRMYGFNTGQFQQARQLVAQLPPPPRQQAVR